MVILKIKQNKDIRNKNYIRIINRYIQSYIKNPIGSLNLENTPISVLPDNLKYIDTWLDIECTNISTLPDDIVINGDLWCFFTPLSNLYIESELRNKYKIKGNIHGV